MLRRKFLYVIVSDDTVILETSKEQQITIENLQMTIENIYAWTGRRKIKINREKLVHLNSTLRKVPHIPEIMNQKIIPRQNLTKFLVILGNAEEK